MFCKSAAFESERLLFRGITESDEDNLIRWRSREDVYRHTPNPQPITIGEHKAWFSKYMKNEHAYRAIIIEKSSNESIGMVGGEYENDAFVISYYIGEPSYRGKGLASEAISALIAFISATNNITMFHAYVQEDNLASISCLSKVGFSLVSVTDKTNLYTYKEAM